MKFRLPHTLAVVAAIGASQLADCSAQLLLSYGNRFNAGAASGGHLEHITWNAREESSSFYNASIPRYHQRFAFPGPDPAGTNVALMGEGGVGSVLRGWEVPSDLGEHSTMVWSGWFDSTEGQVLSNGATLLDIPGHIEITGGTDSFIGGMSINLWHSNDDQPISLTTQPFAFDRPDSGRVFWAVSYDSTAEDGHLRVYRSEEDEPIRLITQASISDPGLTSAATEVISVGNQGTGPNAFQRPFVGIIDGIRVYSEACDLTCLEWRKKNPAPAFMPPQPDFDRNGIVDTRDTSILRDGWTGYLPRHTGDRNFYDGDTDFDGDVDVVDLLVTVGDACFSARSLEKRGGLIGSDELIVKQCTIGAPTDPDLAQLFYDVRSGRVWLDASDTHSQLIDGFVIGSSGGLLLPENMKLPWLDVGTNTDVSEFQIGQLDPLIRGSGPFISLGEVLPPQIAFTSEELDEVLDTNLIVNNLGQSDGHGQFQLIVDGLVIGDFDFDDDIDTADRTSLAINWTGALVPGTGSKRFPDGDTDGDGDVDSADATTFAQRTWERGHSEATLIVPEPKSGFPLMLVCLFLVRKAKETKRATA